MNKLLDIMPPLSKLVPTQIRENDDMEPLDVSKVRDIVTEKGTDTATVTVLKSNGTQRVINGVFKPSNDFNIDESLTKEGRIPIYCLAENAWKSFKEHRVLEIT